MMHFQLSDELGKQVISAAETLQIETDEWLRLAVANALETAPKTPAEPYVRATTHGGRSPGHYVKPDAETVLPIIAACRKQLQHAQRTSSQPASV